ncbi:MAG: TonB-dependent receptor [Bryobacterales bacterium]|nr:TonB-dependent receptor [Bryobacterales bacterium]
MVQGRPLKALVVIVLCWVPPALLAQQRTSAVSGTVRDQSGAAVAGATVTTTHRETGRTRSCVSDSIGYYRLPLLEIGEYSVEASLDGFRTSRSGNVLLQIDREAVVDHVLEVGPQSDSILVEASPRTIAAAPSALTSIVDSKIIEELPLNGRDYIQLATLQAGAPIQRAQDRNVNTGFGLQISISGSRPTQNNFQLDGVSVVSYNGSTPGSINGVNLGVDAVEEFSVHSSAFSAQYGRASGGVINAVTKAGGNDLHGTAYYFHRNDNLDARNFFDPGALPEFRRNQAGSSLGGPIARNKTFFFVNYEGLREARGNTTINTTISAEARNGNLKDGRVQVDPFMAKIAGFYPLPNGEVFGDTGLFVFANGTVAREDFVTTRVDHNFRDADKIFVRYSFDDGERLNETEFAIGKSSDTNRFHSGVVEHVHAFSPNVIHSARLGFLRTNTLVGDTVSQTPGTDDPSLAFLPTENVLGQIVVQDLSEFPGGSGATDVDDHDFLSVQPSNDLTWLRGRHAVKIGSRFERTHFNTDSQNTSSGEYQFSTLTDLLTNRPRRFRAQLPGSDTARRHRQWIGALYLQDTWQATRRLTLDLGVRWEWTTVPTEVDGKVANLDNLSDTEMRVGDPLFTNPSMQNVAPRVGAACDLFGNGKTMLRGGFGLYQDLILSHNLIVSAVRNPPFYLRADVRNPPQGALPIAGYQQIVANGNPELRVERFPRDTAQPYVQQWNFILEQTLDANHTFRLGYVGSRGHNLLSMVEDANLAEPIVLPDGRLFYAEDGKNINQVFGRIRDRRFEADSFYHALNTQFRRRFSDGLQAQVSYSFSKSIDDSSNFFSTTEGANSISLPVNGHPRFNRGLSAHDVRHYFVANAVWELPVDDGAGWRRLLGGWQLSPLLTLASGQPTSARMGYDAARTMTTSDDAESGQRPDLVAGRNNNPSTGNYKAWIDVTAFSIPEPGFLGNLGRNTIIGPGLASLDFALAKRIPLRVFGDGASLDFRFEAFNALNRTNFDLPTVERMAIFDRDGLREDAGRITRAGQARELQFGLKIRF